VPSKRKAGALADEVTIERFTVLYDEYYSRVYAYAVSRFGRQLADEVVSEVFLIAWQRICDLPQPALPWLLTVARNTALSQFRAAARQQSIAAELAAWASEAEADVAVAVADRLTVIRALTALSVQDRELLTLVAWHGLSASAAAQVVGCSAAAYFVRLHRARKRLERALNESAQDPAVRRQHSPGASAGVLTAALPQGKDRSR
jgi:RNA polymerase sigma-70 factor (ECF subfamily)